MSKLAFTYLEVSEHATGKVIHRVNVSGKSDNEIIRCEMGMLRNMNTEKYGVGEQSYASAQPTGDIK